ncbi:MAG: ankyrin repeat domain-containing protein [Crocosphaera sp.]
MIPFSRKSPLEQYYKILDKLGKGGMGTTYAAEDVNTGKKVALKVISLQNQTDAKSLDLLEREVTVLKKLNHTNIPKYIDYFQLEDDNKLYLVQELVPGKNLNQQVEEGLRLTEKEVKDIAVQVLSILDYLHNFEPRIIHRDIKPHNLILSDDGQIFLVDFGAVHNAYYNTIMGGTVGIGTVGYMSPEQQIGKPVPASDLYSLGRTLLYLLTRRPPDNLLPHKATVNLEVIRDYIQLSDEFIEWLEKILDPDVDERFYSAKEALKALKNPKLVKQGKLSKIRWFAWLGLGAASVAIATFSYNYRWAFFNRLGLPSPLGLCVEKDITIEYIRGGGKLPNSDLNQCFLTTMDDTLKDDDGNVALFEAANQGYTDVIKVLVNSGIDVNLQVSGGYALRYAAFSGHKKTVQQLIDLGANVNLKNDYHVTSLHEAVGMPINKNEQKDIVNILLSHGADVNVRDGDGWTPLFHEVNYGSLTDCNNRWCENTGIVKLLIANGADVNFKDPHGMTPLDVLYMRAYKNPQDGPDVAYVQPRPSVVKLLISNGARLTNEQRRYLLHWAESEKDQEMINLLKKHGAR